MALAHRLIIPVIAFAIFVGVVFTLFSILSNKSDSDVHHRAAVVTNGVECAKMAGQILKEGGSAADAAITAILCEGVACPQSGGIGGGLVMTIFSKAANKTEVLIAGGEAPKLATEDMFVNATNLFEKSGAVIAIPGEIKGLWELHQKYGKLPWSRLFEPVIELCRKGHIVTQYLGLIFFHRQDIFKSPTIADVFVDPRTNTTYRTGDYIKRHDLIETLELLAQEGTDTLYNNGTVAQRLVKDIQEEGGILSIEDLMNYKVRWESPISVKLKNNRTLHVPPLPSTGAMIAFILNVLNDYLPDGESLRSMQRIVETFKYAYALRSELGDGRFVKEAVEVSRKLSDVDYAAHIRSKLNDERTSNNYRDYGARFSTESDYGTANINVLAENGDAIAITTSINQFFGCQKHSRRTGIILNNIMDDFSTPGVPNSYGIPPSPSNFIRPGKLPVTSMAPTILLDQNNDVEVIIGSAGGSKITTAISYVLLRYLNFNESLWEAVHAPRLHHQLLPMKLAIDDNMPKDIFHGLANLGHKMENLPASIAFSSITAIARQGKKLVAMYDSRRLGSISVF